MKKTSKLIQQNANNEVNQGLSQVGGELEVRMKQLTVTGIGKSLFPAKPIRQKNSTRPGKPVMLLSNLFKISVVQNKPIFRYAIEIDNVKEDVGKKIDIKKLNGSSKRLNAIPIRVRGDIARDIIEKTMQNYVEGKKLPVANGYNYCYDLLGKNLFTLFDLFQDNEDGKKKELIILINLPAIIDNKKIQMLPQKFKVTIHKGSKLNIPDLFDFCKGKGPAKSSKELQEHLRLVNTIVRAEIMVVPRNHCTATNTFRFDDNSENISPGVQLNRGYYTSAKLTDSGVVLNVHNVFGTFCEPVSLVDLLVDRYGVSRDTLSQKLDKEIREKLFREVQKKQVEATHINYGSKKRPHYRKYRIEAIDGSSLDTFTMVDIKTNKSKKISIADYFKREYKVNLKYPNLPCIIDKSRKIPLEVCRLVERQRVMRDITPAESAQIISHTALSAEKTFKFINDNMQEIDKLSGTIRDYGLELETKPLQVTGFELTPMSLVGNSRRPIMPKNGEYSMQYEKFVVPVVVNKMIITFIVSQDDRKDSQVRFDIENNKLETDTFVKYFKSAAESKGVLVRLWPKNGYINEFNILVIDKNEFDFKARMTKFVKDCNKSKTDHVIFVLPPSCQDYIYRYLQYLEATAREGRKSNEKWTRISCLKYENYKKKIVQDNNNGVMFLTNLLLKYNTKLGGVNYVLNSSNSYSFLGPDYLFIAVDVCHPAPGDKLIQSVAAAVGMWDLTNPRLSYCTRLRVQKKTSENGSSTREDVVDIGNMVEDILRSYNARKKCYPKNIVILRDGVSEGQFQMVLESELCKVKSSLMRMYGKKEQPKLSCLVVQKRHKVRFMRQKPVLTRKGEKDHNMQPGTVVDSGVIHPNDFSFYLTAHKTIQGTAKPAHIFMILDEIKFSQDHAQAMVHALSYLSPRCTRSTSIPTPINLADRAAERGKNVVISWNDDNRMLMDEDARLGKLNKLLDNLGDNNYLNTLFYI